MESSAFIDDLVAGILRSSRLAISRALTLCESTHPKHALQATTLLRRLVNVRRERQQQQQEEEQREKDVGAGEQGAAFPSSSGSSSSGAGVLVSSSSSSSDVAGGGGDGKAGFHELTVQSRQQKRGRDFMLAGAVAGAEGLGVRVKLAGWGNSRCGRFGV
jgi:hypothetical protein